MKLKITFFILFSLLSFFTHANVVITGTRVIYPANMKSINVQLTNVSNSPALVQAWLDKGEVNSSPNSVKVPFVIAPPVTRVEANAGQTLRISFTHTETLPQDRESLFFFNLLDIPPKPSQAQLAENPNYLQIAIRSRLKFFYRPANLTPGLNDAYANVQWIAQNGSVKVKNTSPYYITFSGVKIANQRVKGLDLLAPFAETQLNAKASKGAKVHWTVVNDYGGDQSGESVVQ